MNSIEIFLNESLPTLKVLYSNLDEQNNSLKEKSAHVSKSIETKRRHLADQRHAQFESLAVQFKTLSTQDGTSLSALQKDSIEETLNQSLATPDLEDSVKCQISRIRDLLDARGLVSVLAQLRGIRPADLSSSDEAMKSFAATTKIEKQIGHYLTSNNTAIQSLASKSLDSIRANFRAPFQKHAQDQLREFLQTSNWPNTIKDVHGFETAFSKSLRCEESPITPTSPSSPIALDSFAILAEAFNLRFKFHFDGNRETNRVDKVEWIFNYVTGFLDERINFFDGIVQQVLLTIDEIDGQHRIALHEFILAVLPCIKEKLFKLLPQVIDSPPLLSHTIYEALSFDSLIRERYFFSPYNWGESAWKGITVDLLNHDYWFDKWLNVEQESALSRFGEIVIAPNAWDIDWESVEANKTKPTISAILVNDLLEAVTERYSKLQSVRYKLSFLEIQINILDKYYDRLKESIDAFESMSSGIARAVGGISAENAKLVSGLNGVERLCKIYGSIQYLIKALEKWGQDLVFVELWEDISKANARRPTIESVNVTIPDDVDDEGTLFDETIASYQKLRLRVSLNTNNLIKKEIKASMKDYFRSGHWSTDTHTVASLADLTISSKLVQPIKTLLQLLSYLSKFHTPNDFSKLSKQAGKDLQKYISNYIVQANIFNRAGGQQLSKDVDEIWAALLLPHDLSLQSLEDTCKILSCDKDAISEGVTSLKDRLNISLPIDEIRRVIQRRNDL